jgi:hypothetical protein
LILGKSDDPKKLTLLCTLETEKRSAIRKNYSYREIEFKIDYILVDIHPLLHESDIRSIIQKSRPKVIASHPSYL